MGGWNISNLYDYFFKIFCGGGGMFSGHKIFFRTYYIGFIRPLLMRSDSDSGAGGHGHPPLLRPVGKLSMLSEIVKVVDGGGGV